MDFRGTAPTASTLAGLHTFQEAYTSNTSPGIVFVQLHTHSIMIAFLRADTRAKRTVHQVFGFS